MTKDFDYPKEIPLVTRGESARLTRRELNEGMLMGYLEAQEKLRKAHLEIKRYESELKVAGEKTAILLLGKGPSSVEEVSIWVGDQLYKVTRVKAPEGCKVEKVVLGN